MRLWPYQDCGTAMNLIEERTFFTTSKMTDLSYWSSIILIVAAVWIIQCRVTDFSLKLNDSIRKVIWVLFLWKDLIAPGTIPTQFKISFFKCFKFLLDNWLHSVSLRFFHPYATYDLSLIKPCSLFAWITLW